MTLVLAIFLSWLFVAVVVSIVVGSIMARSNSKFDDLHRHRLGYPEKKR